MIVKCRPLCTASGMINHKASPLGQQPYAVIEPMRPVSKDHKITVYLLLVKLQIYHVLLIHASKSLQTLLC